MMASFTNDVKKFAIKAGLNVDSVVRATVIDLSSKVITRTPVDTGRARGNWMPSVGSPDPSTTESVDVSGAGQLSKVVAKAKDAPGRVYYLINNLPYIRRLEYDAWSKQAPFGMLRTTIQEFKDAVAKAARKVKK